MGEVVKHKYKKYILFSYPGFYPDGGMKDLVGSFDTIEDAKKSIGQFDNFSEIVDRDTWEIAWEDETNL